MAGVSATLLVFFVEGIVLYAATDILEGRHPAPPEFAPLYAVLSAIAAQHTATLKIRLAVLQRSRLLAPSCCCCPR